MSHEASRRRARRGSAVFEDRAISESRIPLRRLRFIAGIKGCVGVILPLVDGNGSNLGLHMYPVEARIVCAVAHSDSQTQADSAILVVQRRPEYLHGEAGLGCRT